MEINNLNDFWAYVAARHEARQVVRAALRGGLRALSLDQLEELDNAMRAEADLLKRGSHGLWTADDLLTLAQQVLLEVHRRKKEKADVRQPQKEAHQPQEKEARGPVKVDDLLKLTRQVLLEVREPEEVPDES